MAIAPRNNDRFAATGMKSVADDGLTRLIVGIMKSFRRRRGPSLGAGPERKRRHAGAAAEPDAAALTLYMV